MVRSVCIVSTIDSHTACEPTRLVTGKLPPLRGGTMAEKMLFARTELDGLRGLLMLEPRGRQDMHGAVLTESSALNADFGLIFMNTEQCTTMCGHAIIGAATTVIETGMVRTIEPETTVVFDTPVGLMTTRARIQDGSVHEVASESTPVFLYQPNALLMIPDLGEIPVDIVYSGGFFALVRADLIGLDLVPANAKALTEWGMQLHHLANEQLPVQHPDLAFFTIIDAVEFHGPVQRQEDGALHARNVATFGQRTVDRSPCGTGICARMALLHARGDLGLGDRFVSEGIIGTRFTGQIIDETHVGVYPAIIARVSGRAHLTGFHQFVLDPEDPFPRGFSLDSLGLEGES